MWIVRLAQTLLNGTWKGAEPLRQEQGECLPLGLPRSDFAPYRFPFAISLEDSTAVAPALTFADESVGNGPRRLLALRVVLERVCEYSLAMCAAKCSPPSATPPARWTPSMPIPLPESPPSARADRNR